TPGPHLQKAAPPPLRGGQRRDAPALALPAPRGDPLRHQRGRHLPQPPQPDRAADGDRADAAGGEPELHRLLVLPRQRRRPGIRVLHPHRGRCGIGDRPRHPGGAVPQYQHHRRRRPGLAARMKELAVTAAFAPLAGAIIAGLGGRWLTRQGAHTAAIFSVLLSFLASCVIFWRVLQGETYNDTVYTWLASDTYRFQVGFLIDRLTALMMIVVSFVSLMVHIYTIGYMADDPGYKRFFSYIALFTFCMLVLANNYVQLFFGWEGVGLVSYLLIGFWYTRESAVYAGLKAFLVNRVGDFGFILGIALILANFGTLDYAPVFASAPKSEAPM